MKILAKNLKEMEQVANDFSKKISSGDCIILNGDLGAGKTTFTQFVLKNLGVKEVVTSPTFAILKSYQGKFKFNHFDMYRITTDEAIEAGLDEILNEKDSVNIIEWAENVEPILPKKQIIVNIKVNDNLTRQIEINE